MLWWLLIERRAGYGCGDAVDESGRVAGVTAAQDQVRDQQYADRERIARLEVQFDESNKRLATKADVEAAIGDVRSDIRVLRIWLFVGVLVLAILDDINMIAVLLQLRRLGGG